MDQKTFLEIVHVAERLKDAPRHCVTSNGRRESVAEHSWRIALMAFLLKGQYPDLDVGKVIDMCLIHDLGEAFTGDKPCFTKTEADSQEELRQYRAWVAQLPAEVSARMFALIDEMEARETPEALLYKSLDQMEAVIQHNESPISSWLPLEYDLQKNYGHDCCRFDPWLTGLRQEILSDTLRKIETEGKTE